MRKPPRRGPISWVRRRLLPQCARLLVAGVLLVLAGWTVGQVLTDEYYPSQYLWWIPTPAVLAVCWPMVLASWLLEKMSIRLGGYQLRPILSAALFGITVWYVFGVGRVHRLLFPAERGSLRVVYWNLAVDDEADGAGKVVSSLAPDLAIVANPRWDQTRAELLDSMRAISGDQPAPGSEPDTASERPADQTQPGEEAEGVAEPVVEPVVEPAHFLFSNEIAISTRGSIERWGSVTFAAAGVNDYEHRGVVLFAEVSGLSPEPLTVWVVDLPSAPALWRMEVMEMARQAVLSWDGRSFVPRGDGRWSLQTGEDAFPNADLIVGDFNTPRGSKSLETLVGALSNAASARRGFGYTWPRDRALLAIDHCFVGRHFEAVGQRTLDAGMGRHRVVVTDLKPD